LEVYEHLKEKALAISPDFNITPFLTSSAAGRAVYKCVVFSICIFTAIPCHLEDKKKKKATKELRK